MGGSRSPRPRFVGKMQKPRMQAGGRNQDIAACAPVPALRLRGGHSGI
nr:MAG TPA: hypothetical protein [Caudoviricetes sp.]